MGRSQETFSKKEKEKKRLKKRQDKEVRKADRKANAGGDFDSMIAYVDEFGNLVDTPPEQGKKAEINLDDIQLGATKREESAAPAFRTGVVVFFNSSKGYGFIREDNSDEKFFVHANGLLANVVENDKVSFQIERGQKGMNAVEVQKI
jgi:cold shock CspA family protein